jgi:hypothetical protein
MAAAFFMSVPQTIDDLRPAPQNVVQRHASGSKALSQGLNSRQHSWRYLPAIRLSKMSPEIQALKGDNHTGRTATKVNKELVPGRSASPDLGVAAQCTARVIA